MLANSSKKFIAVYMPVRPAADADVGSVAVGWRCQNLYQMQIAMSLAFRCNMINFTGNLTRFIQNMLNRT